MSYQSSTFLALQKIKTITFTVCYHQFCFSRTVSSAVSSHYKTCNICVWIVITETFAPCCGAYSAPIIFVTCHLQNDIHCEGVPFQIVYAHYISLHSHFPSLQIHKLEFNTACTYGENGVESQISFYVSETLLSRRQSRFGKKPRAQRIRDIQTIIRVQCQVEQAVIQSIEGP